MVQLTLEQCYNKKTPPPYEIIMSSGEEEEEILLPHVTAKNVALDNLITKLENDEQQQQQQQQQQYQSSYEDDDHSSLGVDDPTSEDSGDIDRWSEDNKRLDDPVGDIITDMLNEGSIPYFGYQNYLQQQQQQQMQNGNSNFTQEEDTFDWTHIVCVRNFRALRKVILGEWAIHNYRLDGQHYSSMKFLQEIFLFILVAAYAVSDVALRMTSWLGMMAVMWVVHTLIDLDELHHGLVEVLGSNRVERLTKGMNQCHEYWKRIMETIHADFLWGRYFQGRVLVWSEEERLPKFRRKHITLIRIIKERKQNSKTTRRLERDIKRSKRKGLMQDAAEALIVNEAKIMLQTRKKELDATMKELNQKPPTYFPSNLVSLQEEKEERAASLVNNLSRSDATNGHLVALRFCHKMVFLRDQEAQQQLKKQAIDNQNDVSITHSTSDSIDHIEVVSKDVNSMSPFRARSSSLIESDDDSTACSYFPAIGEHWDSESDGGDSSISYADSTSTSEQALPWLAVGAKIGEKLLKSRKLQRVVANPDEIQKSLPNEAMKLIDGMDISDEANEIASELLIVKTKSTERKKEEKKREKERELKQEMESIKRPVHGLWSSPGTASSPLKARPQKPGTPGRFAVIQMPTSFDDPSFSTPTARLQNGLLKQPSIDRQPKQINRLAPIDKGVRIIVPFFSPDPNISTSLKSSSFHQMVSLLFFPFSFYLFIICTNRLNTNWYVINFFREPLFLLVDAMFHRIDQAT